LATDLLNGAQVGRIFWKEELGPGGADELAHGFTFVAAEIPCQQRRDDEKTDREN
jgi:hypothetical protein